MSKYARHFVRRLEAAVFPAVGDIDIGDIDIGEVTPRQMLKIFRRIQARGSLEKVHRIKNYCS